MRNFSKIIIISALIMQFMTGCTPLSEILENENGSQNSSTSKIQSKDSLSVIIEALDNKDRELLKSIFSEEAILHSGDMDEAIDYIFDMYKGKFVKRIDVNMSAQTINGQEASFSDRVAVIETTESCYQINWKQWGKNEMNPTYVGVYSLSLCEYDENDNPDYAPYTVGVRYPEKETYETISESVVCGLFREDVQNLKDIFTDELNLNSEKSGTLGAFMDRYSFDESCINTAWIKDDMYFMKIRNFEIYICIKLDKETGKVKSIRILDAEEYTDNEAENYDFSSDENEIYMISK